MDDWADRLAAIAQIADALMDSLPGDNWSLARAIEQIARGEQTPDEALAELEED